MSNNILLSIARHLLTAYGATLVTNGVIGSSDLDAVIGSVITLAGILWSIFDKKIQANKLAAAIAAPAVPGDPVQSKPTLVKF